MNEENTTNQLVDRFIADEIESVPHLEALLLFWRTRPRSWPLMDMAKALYLEAGTTREILDDIAQRGLIVPSADLPPAWEYASDPARDYLIGQVDRAYQTELIRISRMIHSKRPGPMREFARAFRFTKKEGG